MQPGIAQHTGNFKAVRNWKKSPKYEFPWSPAGRDLWAFLWPDLSVPCVSFPVLVTVLSLLFKFLNSCFLLEANGPFSEPGPPASSSFEPCSPVHHFSVRGPPGTISSEPCPLKLKSFEPGLPVSTFSDSGPSASTFLEMVQSDSCTIHLLEVWSSSVRSCSVLLLRP